MTTDRELLELAAKAAGIELTWRAGSCCFYYDDPETGREEWSPGEDDGQAFRLAVKLSLQLHCGSNLHRVSACDRSDFEPFFEYYDADGTGKAAAMRLAIVRVAAAIGKAMP
jgi:hypothetical protein